jgi:phosphoribosylanthranilate isomerase
MTSLKIKVCGMKFPDNIDAVCAARPDYVGFIFYPESKRYVGEDPDEDIFARVPDPIQKVGVFVNEKPRQVMEICRKYMIQVAQLHGNESAEYCLEIRNSGLSVIKAFSVYDTFDFDQLKDYSALVDFFLFDTKGKLPGGTGERYNWQILNKYQLNIPFFVSGGIKYTDSKDLRDLNLSRLVAVDINSGFELKPGLKDSNQVGGFIEELRSSERKLQ